MLQPVVSPFRLQTSETTDGRKESSKNTFGAAARANFGTRRHQGPAGRGRRREGPAGRGLMWRRQNQPPRADQRPQPARRNQKRSARRPAATLVRARGRPPAERRSRSARAMRISWMRRATCRRGRHWRRDAPPQAAPPPTHNAGSTVSYSGRSSQASTVGSRPSAYCSAPRTASAQWQSAPT